MRVIAGTARGAALEAPRGLATRPTTDRLKENLFNMLAPRMAGARFLDLYSGSGAIGIEALSRGAAEAVLVENAPRALEVIRINLQKTRLAGQAEVLAMSAKQALRYLRKNERRFDLVFLDPPYGQGLVADTLGWLAETDALARDGWLVTETPAGEAVCAHAGFAVEKEKRYGDIRFTWYAAAAL